MPLKLATRKGRPHYFLRGTVRGQKIFETTGTDDKEAAEAIRIKRENELLHSSIFGESTAHTFAEVVISYLEAGGEAQYLGTWDTATKKGTLLLGRLHDKPIGTIGQADADAAAVALYPKGKNATRRRHVYGPLKAVLSHAEKKDWGPTKRIKSPKVDPVNPVWAPPEWFEKLLPCCSTALRRFVLLSPYTGRRLSEFMRLEWAQINLQEQTVTFLKTKNKKMKTLHIHDLLFEELCTVPQEERHGRVLHWTNRTSVRAALKTACQRAGIPYLSPHKMGRHTFAAWDRIYGKRDLPGVMDDGGWESITSVIKYKHVVAGETLAAIKGLPSVPNASQNFGLANNRLIRKKKPA